MRHCVCYVIDRIKIMNICLIEPLFILKGHKSCLFSETLIEGNFEKESARLASFQHYRHKDYFSNDIICALALHGFYYSETYDAVLCFR